MSTRQETVKAQRTIEVDLTKTAAERCEELATSAGISVSNYCRLILQESLNSE